MQQTKSFRSNTLMDFSLPKYISQKSGQISENFDFRFNFFVHVLLYEEPIKK